MSEEFTLPRTLTSHFSHRRILEYCKRPFTSIQEHDEMLICLWNETVSPEDHIYHLGDLSFSHPNKTEEILRRLNGTKYLVHGNHDKKRNMPRDLSLFIDLGMYHEIHITDEGQVNGSGRLFVLFHYPIESWRSKKRGSVHCYGHTHEPYEESPPRTANRVNVGVDRWHYKPISHRQILNYLGIPKER